MGIVSDEFPAVMKATQARRILTCLSKAQGFTVLAPSNFEDGKGWGVLCEGECFGGETMVDALAQCAQWLVMKGV